MSEPSFDLAALARQIAGTAFAGHLHFVASVDSTNSLALAAARAGGSAGVWIAGEQTAGRGRGGHRWHSAARDGLYVSVLVTDRPALAALRLLPLAAGLAAQAAVREACGLALDLRWPNDLMLGERKCGGILVESSVEPAASPAGPRATAPPLPEAAAARVRFAVLGIGLNLNQEAFPAELASVATSLRLADGRTHAREAVLAALLRALDGELEALDSQPAATLLARFGAASSWVSGKQVRVGLVPENSYTGVTAGLDREGFLLVEDSTGALQTVVSGEVRSEPAQSFKR